MYSGYFEWDENKDQLNQRNHEGISFKIAALVFDDPNVLFEEDRVEDGEQRWHAVEMVESAILIVVHCYRE